MSECADCGKDVHRYIVSDGQPFCMKCAPMSVRHLDGFRHEGRPVPTATDHARNLGANLPSREFQRKEYSQMREVSQVGGSRGKAPDYSRILNRALRTK